jgi:ubiquinol-cytochrome c reductase cytochrome b subunit
MHLLALHTNGSSNPLGITGNIDRIAFHPYFVFKDLITVIVFLLVYSIMVFYYPNMLGDVENYIAANPLVTPTAIVPEFYLLPFYAILRSIPNKLLGVVFMLAAILILLLLPTLDKSIIRGNTFRILSKLFYGFFICNFLLLGVLGAQHIEAPYILLGQISTMLYFAHFLIFVPFISVLENTLFYINSISNSASKGPQA